MDLGEMRGGSGLREMEGGQTAVRMYYMKEKNRESQRKKKSEYRFRWYAEVEISEHFLIYHFIAYGNGYFFLYLLCQKVAQCQYLFPEKEAWSGCHNNLLGSLNH